MVDALLIALAVAALLIAAGGKLIHCGRKRERCRDDRRMHA